MVNILIFLIKSKVKVFQNAKYLDSLHYYGTFTIYQDLEPKLLLAIRSNKIKHVLYIASYLKKKHNFLLNITITQSLWDRGYVYRYRQLSG